MIFALVYIFIVLCGLSSLARAQIPCDDAYGAFCPEEAGWGVQSCLKKVDAADLTSECAQYVAIHDACEADIKEHCAGKEFTGDLLPCLTEWTKPADLSEGCASSLPKKEATKKKEMTADQKRRANKRREIRNKAAKKSNEQAA